GPGLPSGWEPQRTVPGGWVPIGQQYPTEVKALRAKANHVWKALVVVTDADALSTAERRRQLSGALAGAGLAERAEREAIALAIPKWEIEAWAEHLLRRTSVAEDAKMGWAVDKSERDCTAAGSMLRSHRQGNPMPPSCCPPSLAESDAEFARLRAPD